MLINIVFAVRCTIIQQYSSAVCTLRAMISANAAHKVRYMLVLHKVYGVQCNTMIRKRISTTTIDIKTMNRTAKRNENYLRCALHFASLIYPLVTMHPIFKCFSFKRARAISFAYTSVFLRFVWINLGIHIYGARERETNEIDIAFLLSIAHLINNRIFSVHFVRLFDSNNVGAGKLKLCMSFDRYAIFNFLFQFF